MERAMKRVLILAALVCPILVGQTIEPGAGGGTGGGGGVSNVSSACGLTGGPITASGTLQVSQSVNSQTGTSYTLLAADCGRLVTFSNAGAIAVTLPQAGVNFPDGWFVDVSNRGAGLVTITPTTSTIDGAATLTVATNEGLRIVSNGTNYFTVRGKGGSGEANTTSALGGGISPLATTPKSGAVLQFGTFAGTAPLTVSKVGEVITFTMPVATNTDNGYLSAADRILFNSKQAALGYTPINPANNGSDFTNMATLRTNIGLAIGSQVQAFSTHLGAIAGFTHANGRIIMSNGSTYVPVDFVDCDNPTTSKMMFDLTTRTLTCGTDQTGGASSLSDIDLTNLKMVRTDATTLSIGAGSYKVMGKTAPITWAGGTAVSSISGGGDIVLCGTYSGLGIATTTTADGTVAAGLTDLGTLSGCPAGSTELGRWGVTTGALDATQTTANAAGKALLTVAPPCESTDTITYTRNITTGACEGEVTNATAPATSKASVSNVGPVTIVSASVYTTLASITVPPIAANTCAYFSMRYSAAGTGSRSWRLLYGTVQIHALFATTVNNNVRTMQWKLCNGATQTSNVSEMVQFFTGGSGAGDTSGVTMVQALTQDTSAAFPVAFQAISTVTTDTATITSFDVH
jgi:hypothetical protein